MTWDAADCRFDFVEDLSRVTAALIVGGHRMKTESPYAEINAGFEV